MEAAVDRRQKWKGTAQLRRIAGLVSTGGVSGAEFLFHDLLRQARISGWRANVPIDDACGLIAVADVVFAAQRVVIEIDGFRAHSSRARFVADRRRQNRLVMAGYQLLRSPGTTWSSARPT